MGNSPVAGNAGEPAVLSVFCNGSGVFRIHWDAQNRRFECSKELPLFPGETPETPPEHQPTAAEWATFWSIVRHLGVWNWKGEYNPDVICGRPFFVRLSIGAEQLESRGNLAGSETVPNFSLFERSLKALANYQSNWGKADSLADMREIASCLCDAPQDPESIPQRLRQLIARKVSLGDSLLSFIPRMGSRADLLVPLLAENLTTESYVAEALTLLGPKAAPALPALEAAVLRGNRRWNAPVAAIRAMGVQTAGVAYTLRKIAHEAEGPARIAAIKAVCEFAVDGRGLQGLLEGALKAADREVREAAAECLHSLGVRGLPLIRAALHDSQFCTRRAALWSLTRLGACGGELQPEIERLLKDPNAAIRRAAIRCQSAVARTPEAVQLLLPLLSDGEYFVRQDAAQAIRSYGRMADGVVPQLLKALEEFGGEAISDTLMAASEDRDDLLVRLASRLDADSPETRGHVLSALWHVGGATRDNLDHSLRLCGDPNPSVRKVAVGSLSGLPAELGKDAVPVLASLLRDHDVSAEVANVLGTLGRPALAAVEDLAAVVDELDGQKAEGAGPFCIARALRDLILQFPEEFDEKLVRDLRNIDHWSFHMWRRR